MIPCTQIAQKRGGETCTREGRKRGTSWSSKLPDTGLSSSTPPPFPLFFFLFFLSSLFITLFFYVVYNRCVPLRECPRSKFETKRVGVHAYIIRHVPENDAARTRIPIRFHAKRKRNGVFTISLETRRERNLEKGTFQITGKLLIPLSRASFRISCLLEIGGGVVKDLVVFDKYLQQRVSDILGFI